VRKDQRPETEAVIKGCLEGYRFLQELTTDEAEMAPIHTAANRIYSTRSQMRDKIEELEELAMRARTEAITLLCHEDSEGHCHRSGSTGEVSPSQNGNSVI